MPQRSLRKRLARPGGWSIPSKKNEKSTHAIFFCKLALQFEGVNKDVSNIRSYIKKIYCFYKITQTLPIFKDFSNTFNCYKRPKMPKTSPFLQIFRPNAPIVLSFPKIHMFLHGKWCRILIYFIRKS